MKSNYIEGALKNIRRNKKNTILIFIFFLLLFLLFVDVFIFKNFVDYYDSAMKRIAGFRTLSVYNPTKTPDETIPELKKINHVQDVYESYYGIAASGSNLNDEGLNGQIGLYYGPISATPKSVIGKNIEDLESGELVCPYAFYPDGSYENVLEIDESKFLSEKETFNQEIVITYDSSRDADANTQKISKNMRIVGLYDETILREGINVCYANKEDIKAIVDTYNPFLKTVDYSSLRVVVDKQSNLKKVRKDIQDAGMYMIDDNGTSSLDMEFVVTLFSVVIIVAIVLILSIVFIIKNYISKKIKNEGRHMGILRACGYTKKQVIMKELVENGIVLVISFILSIGVFSILYIILYERIFRYFQYIGFDIRINLLTLLLVFVLVVFLSEYINYKLICKKIDESISNILIEE